MSWLQLCYLETRSQIPSQNSFAPIALAFLLFLERWQAHPSKCLHWFFPLPRMLAARITLSFSPGFGSRITSPQNSVTTLYEIATLLSLSRNVLLDFLQKHIPPTDESNTFTICLVSESFQYSICFIMFSPFVHSCIPTQNRVWHIVCTYSIFCEWVTMCSKSYQQKNQ